MGVASLILGILSFLIAFSFLKDLSLILGVLAVVLGIIAIAKKKGKATGIIGIILSVIAIIVLFSEGGSSTKQESYKVGENYQDSNIKITFVSTDTDFTKYSKYAEIKKGNKVIKAEFELENVGSSDQYADYSDFKCYADDTACDEFYSVDDAGLDGPLNANLSAGKKVKGNVYFEVPKNAEKIIIEYNLNMFSDDKVTFNVR